MPVQIESSDLAWGPSIGESLTVRASTLVCIQRSKFSCGRQEQGVYGI